MTHWPLPPLPLFSRRRMLSAFALPWLAAGCSTPLPIGVSAPAAADANADARLRDSALAHGLDAYRQLTDINVSYGGQWRPLVGRLQPEVVDAGFRGASQERLMPRLGLVAQDYLGYSGRKHVTWQRGAPAADTADHGRVAVWFNDVPSTDTSALDAAALVAEGYGLFLLGPLWLADRRLALRSGGTEQVDGRICDIVEVWLTPGLGRVATDRVALCIDRRDALMRRVRFTLEGFANTRGAVAEVDTFEHDRRFGLVWPMRSYERVVHPIALPAHDWHITGLDVNRGYAPSDLRGPSFGGAAAAPARAV